MALFENMALSGKDSRSISENVFIWEIFLIGSFPSDEVTLISLYVLSVYGARWDGSHVDSAVF